MKSKKVLIVDDNDLNRGLFENLIGQYYQFESAKNGIEALELLKHGKFDLILMDIQMPQMDGFTALKKIKQGNLSECPVIAVTAYAEENDRNSFLTLGFDEFITKPIRPKQFLDVINRTIENILSAKGVEDQIAYEELILDKKVVAQLIKFNANHAIQEVYNDFVLECNELWIDIGQALKDNQLDVLMDKLHILKGNSGTLGANSIYLRSLKAEDAAKAKILPELEVNLLKLKKEIDLFQQFIKEETIFEL